MTDEGGNRYVVPGVHILETRNSPDVDDDCGEKSRVFINGMRLIPPAITPSPRPRLPTPRRVRRRHVFELSRCYVKPSLPASPATPALSDRHVDVFHAHRGESVHQPR